LKRFFIALAVASVGAAMSPSQAWVGYQGRSFEPLQVWYHANTTPIGNLDHQLGADPTWDTVAPTAAGALTVGNNYSTFTDIFQVPGGTRREHTFNAKGSFTGEMDTIAVELYFTGPAAAVCGMSLAWEVLVDGNEILYTPQSSPSADLRTEGVGRNVFKVKFMLSHISEAMELYQIPTGPEFTHEISLNFANFYACQEAVWLYDSPSWPSGMIFNLDPASTQARGYTEVNVLNPPPPLPA
jgi:hypothetical protein